MNSLVATYGPWQLAGWTMLHYLWIGAILGLAAFVIRRATGRLAPQVRYGVALAWLVVLATVPFVIAAYLSRTDVIPDAEEASLQPTMRTVAGPLPASFAGVGIAATQRGPTEANQDQAEIRVEAVQPMTERIGQALEPLVSWLPWIWLLGTPLCVLVVASGLYGAERMRRGAMLVIEGPISEALQRSQGALAFGRAVAVAVSDRIVSPLVLGIVKPLILLPASAAAGWSPEQLQMILLHELAHVRRWDNLVNLLQRIVEAALFYQPAIWVVSNWVRLEREHCCDAVVLAQGNGPQDYAETLASLAMPGISPRYAAAALASHQLVSRIRHILNVEDRTMKVSRRALLTLICGAVLFSSLVVVYAQQQTEERRSSRPEKINLTDKDDAASDTLAKDTRDADRELTLLRAHRDRLMKVRRQVQVLAESYSLGTVTPDFYADGVRREANASQEYARAFQALLERIMQRGKLDSASHQLLKTLMLVEGGTGSADNRVANPAVPQVAQELEQIRKPAETEPDTAMLADLKAQRDKALTEWKYRKAELQRRQGEADALHKKVADAGDSVSPELKELYFFARSEVDTASSDEARARSRYDFVRRKIDNRAQSVVKPGWSAAQLIGPPDAEPGREDGRAWSSATPDGQSEWIEVIYAQPVEAVAVMISESYNPGAIGSIKSFDAHGKWEWVAESLTARPIDKDRQVTTIPLSERPVTKLRIAIESVSVPGYNQIDAVGLLDRKGQMHWATAATASSDRSQAKSAGASAHEDSFTQMIEYFTKGGHADVFVKNMNCQNCHQIQAASDDADPRLQALSRWIEAHTLNRPRANAAASAAADTAAGVNRDQEREQLLAPLRKEIEEINQEIFKIKEELELQSQGETRRAELERLRKLLEESRKARGWEPAGRQ